MDAPWQLVVVRAWHLDHRRVIRMTMSRDADPVPRTAYVSTRRAAAELLLQWLNEQASGPGADDDASVDPVEATNDDP